jgi:hypothetical protein
MLHVKPSMPLGTRPCIPVSGFDPGLQAGRGTAAPDGVPDPAPASARCSMIPSGAPSDERSAVWAKAGDAVASTAAAHTMSALPDIGAHDDAAAAATS